MSLEKFFNEENKFVEKKLRSELIFDGVIFEVRKDKVELSDGQIKGREYVVHNGGVVVVAQKENKVILVKQYRYPVQKILLEVPAGKLEKNEDPLLAAKRELKEETGYVANSWKELGFIYPSAGMSSEKLYLYFATELEFVEQTPDEGEIIEFEEHEIDEVFEMIKCGAINDAKTICALTRAFKL